MCTNLLAFTLQQVNSGKPQLRDCRWRLCGQISPQMVSLPSKLYVFVCVLLFETLDLCSFISFWNGAIKKLLLERWIHEIARLARFKLNLNYSSKDFNKLGCFFQLSKPDHHYRIMAFYCSIQSPKPNHHMEKKIMKLYYSFQWPKQNAHHMQ